MKAILLRDFCFKDGPLLKGTECVVEGDYILLKPGWCVRIDEVSEFIRLEEK